VSNFINKKLGDGCVSSHTRFMQLQFKVSTDHEHTSSIARLRIQAQPLSDALGECIDDIADIELNRLDARDFAGWLFDNMDAILHEEPPAFLPEGLSIAERIDRFYADLQSTSDNLGDETFPPELEEQIDQVQQYMWMHDLKLGFLALICRVSTSASITES